MARPLNITNGIDKITKTGIMIYLEVSATISPHKLFEFNQSKMVFINNLQKTDGYNGFTEKPGNKFQMKICWNSRKCLDAFMKSELYCVFHGAVITLSQSNRIQILNSKN